MILGCWSENLDDVKPGLRRVHIRGAQVWISWLNYGARIERWRRRSASGDWVDLCLYYPNAEGAIADEVYMGATIGRFANRIAKGIFPLEHGVVQLQCNEGNRNHLHGGAVGFDKCMWSISRMASNEVVFEMCSKSGDQGYPGEVNIAVTYALIDESELRITHNASASATTVLNSTNHAYFNLHGVHNTETDNLCPNVQSHVLETFATHFLEDRGDCVPSGTISEVEGTRYDFRGGCSLALQSARFEDPQFNITYVNPVPQPGPWLARVTAPGAQWSLCVGSDAPGFIFYNGYALCASATQGLYAPLSGFCIEPQAYPDCVNHPQWPSAELRPDEAYSRTITYRIDEV